MATIKIYFTSCWNKQHSYYHVTKFTMKFINPAAARAEVDEIMGFKDVDCS